MRVLRPSGRVFLPCREQEGASAQPSWSLQIAPFRLWSSNCSYPKYIHHADKHHVFLWRPHSFTASRVCAFSPNSTGFVPETWLVLARSPCYDQGFGMCLSMIQALHGAGFPHYIFIQWHCRTRTTRRQTLEEADLAGVQQKQGIKIQN